MERGGRAWSEGKGNEHASAGNRLSRHVEEEHFSRLDIALSSPMVEAEELPVRVELLPPPSFLSSSPKLARRTFDPVAVTIDSTTVLPRNS